jgi:hypothetical protein
MQGLEFTIASTRERKDKLRENLARIFEFSADDLAQNQAGKFGDGQMRRVGAKIATPLFRTAAAASCWLTFVWMLNHSTWFASFFQSMYFMQNGILYDFSHSTPLTVIIGLLFAITPWFVFSGGVTSFLLLLDLIFGEVAKTEGKVWLHHTTARDIETGADDPNCSETNYQYAIGDLRFNVPYDATAALDENTPYRVYYAPRSNMLLSIDPISESQQTPSIT